MKSPSFILSALCLSASLFSFEGNFLPSYETQPWFGEVYEARLDTFYTYSRYTHVNHAKHRLKHPSNDQLVTLDLGMTVSPEIDLAVEAEFAYTPRMPFGLRSGAARMRYLFLDDVSGDPISLTAGLELRGATGRSLRDVSSPYHAAFNAELQSAVGKEWSRGPHWLYRTYGLVAIGQANRGYPWVRSLISFLANIKNHHRFQIFSEGYFGFGDQKEVNIRHFNGWAKIQHRSIDVGASYAYHFRQWGTLSLSYARRVYAHSFPQSVNYATLEYNLPFSLF